VSAPTVRLLLVREVDERLGLSTLIAENIRDERRGKSTQLTLPNLLRQSIYGRLAGYEDVNVAERLSQDPTFRLIGSAKILERGAALPSRQHWFETEVLSRDENLGGLSRINRELLAKVEVMDAGQRVVLDMDSTEIQVYGEQDLEWGDFVLSGSGVGTPRYQMPMKTLAHGAETRDGRTLMPF